MHKIALLFIGLYSVASFAAEQDTAITLKIACFENIRAWHALFQDTTSLPPKTVTLSATRETKISVLKQQLHDTVGSPGSLSTLRSGTFWDLDRTVQDVADTYFGSDITLLFNEGFSFIGNIKHQ